MLLALSGTAHADGWTGTTPNMDSLNGTMTVDNYYLDDMNQWSTYATNMANTGLTARSAGTIYGSYLNVSMVNKGNPPWGVPGWYKGAVLPGAERTGTTIGNWVPQGLTHYAGTHRVIASHYNKTTDTALSNLITITFHDMNLSTPKYRRALLVEPAWNGNFRAVRGHASGVARYGDLLYVVGVSGGGGMRVFDLSKIYEVRNKEDGVTGTYCNKIAGKAPDGKFCGMGQRFVVPQVNHYRGPPGVQLRSDPNVWGYRDAKTAIPKFSTMQVDLRDTTDLLVTAEYCRATTITGAYPCWTDYGALADPSKARITRWAIGSDGRLVKNSSGVVKAHTVYTAGYTHVQGIAPITNTTDYRRYVLNDTAGAGHITRVDLGSFKRWARDDYGRADEWMDSVEGIVLDQSNSTSGNIFWTVTEMPQSGVTGYGPMIFGVRESYYNN